MSQPGYFERQNLGMRMSMRRFTRLTNAFSKKVEMHALHIALPYAYYNFVKVHLGHEHLENTLKVLLVQNQHPVETFRAGRAHKPLGHAVALRRAKRRADDSIPSPRNTSSNRWRNVP